MQARRDLTRFGDCNEELGDLALARRKPVDSEKGLPTSDRVASELAPVAYWATRGGSTAIGVDPTQLETGG